MQKQININISLIRILATIGVVFFHTCCTIVFHPETFEFTKEQEVFFRIGYQIFLWVVPVFFMITGYLLLGSNRDLSYHVVFKKYILRIFLALLIFSLPFSAMKLCGCGNAISITGMIEAFVENNSFSHLWYLYALIGLYLVVPLLNKLVNHVDVKSLVVFLVGLFVVKSVFPMLNGLLNVNIAFDIPIQYPIFYFLTGYLCRVVELKKKYIFWSGGISAFCMILLVVLIVAGHFQYISDNNAAPLISLYAVSLFFFFMNLKFPNISERKASLIWEVDRLCFAVYLIHPFFIQLAYRYYKTTPLSFGEYYPIATFVFFVVFLLLSFACSYVLNKIPLLRKHVL